MKNSVKFIILIIITRMGLNFANSEEMNIWPQSEAQTRRGGRGVSPPIHFGPGNNELAFHLILTSLCISGDSLFVTTFNESNKELG